MKKILVTAATFAEIAPLQERLQRDFEQGENGIFKYENIQVQLLITGVGMLPTGIYLMRFLCSQNIDWVINAGIAGAFNEGLKIGEVVEVGEERFGDVGVQERDGNFTDVFEMKLMDNDEFPFKNGVLCNENTPHSLSLKRVKGLTVNKVHGEAAAIDFIKKKYQADIETMEGAAFFYVCELQKIPYTQIRAISNYVEPRNRANWDIPLAVKNLNEVLWEFIHSFKIHSFKINPTPFPIHEIR